MKRLRLPAAIATLLISALALAGPAPQPWLEPDVIEAALGIGLTAEQQPKFRAIVTAFLTERGQMVLRELRRENPTMSRTIGRKTNAIAKRMDEKLKGILTEEQWPAYENYRKVLISKFRF